GVEIFEGGGNLFARSVEMLGSREQSCEVNASIDGQVAPGPPRHVGNERIERRLETVFVAQGIVDIGDGSQRVNVAGIRGERLANRFRLPKHPALDENVGKTAEREFGRYRRLESERAQTVVFITPFGG